jgi:hypothetical protein
MEVLNWPVRTFRVKSAADKPPTEFSAAQDLVNHLGGARRNIWAKFVP